MSRTLPPRPSLEQLKKQAKDLLKAHRSGESGVCEALRLLHRFRDAGEADILAAEMKLDDCQFALAMDYGFADWAHLRSHVKSAERVARHLGHWQRFGGDAGEKIQMVLRDPQWTALLQTEEELAPLSDEATAIRERIACMEPCHACYAANVRRITEMIGSMRAGPIFDCGETDEARRALARRYRFALESWLAGADDTANLPEVARYLGQADDAKRALVVHLVRKLEDDGYSAYPPEEEDFGKTESRITYLEICSHYWQQSMRVLLQEIGAGERLYDWHTPDGFNTCGDAPDRVAELREFLRGARAWMGGDAGDAGPVRQAFGEPTPEKRWLVESLCKHIQSAAQQGRVLE